MPVPKTKLLFRGLRRGQLQRLIRTIRSLQAQDAAQQKVVDMGEVPVYFAPPGGATATILTQLLTTAQAAVTARG